MIMTVKKLYINCKFKQRTWWKEFIVKHHFLVAKSASVWKLQLCLSEGVLHLSWNPLTEIPLCSSVFGHRPVSETMAPAPHPPAPLSAGDNSRKSFRKNKLPLKTHRDLPAVCHWSNKGHFCDLGRSAVQHGARACIHSLLSGGARRDQHHV